MDSPKKINYSKKTKTIDQSEIFRKSGGKNNAEIIWKVQPIKFTRLDNSRNASAEYCSNKKARPLTTIGKLIKGVSFSHYFLLYT